jgi:Protein of unknown function (DUF3168)
VYDALAASGEVQALLGDPPRLYDHVPPNVTFPYAVFGAIVAKPYDDKDRTGFLQTVTLDIWSRYRGTKEVKDIMQAAYDALHRASLSVSDEVFLSCEFAGAELAPEADGLTAGGRAHFNVITQSS